jgi:hypothetical protein
MGYSDNSEEISKNSIEVKEEVKTFEEPLFGSLVNC